MTKRARAAKKYDRYEVLGASLGALAALFSHLMQQLDRIERLYRTKRKGGKG